MSSVTDRISGPAIDAYQQLDARQQTVIDEFLEANPRQTLYAKRDIVNAWLIYTGIQGYTEQIIDIVQRTFKEPAPVVPAWQPIETAPKGGVLVDILCDGRRYAGCHYDRICDEFRHITACGVLVHLKKASHWMAVPATPQPLPAQRTQ